MLSCLSYLEFWFLLNMKVVMFQTNKLEDTKIGIIITIRGENNLMKKTEEIREVDEYAQNINTKKKIMIIMMSFEEDK